MFSIYISHSWLSKMISKTSSKPICMSLQMEIRFPVSLVEFYSNAWSTLRKLFLHLLLKWKKSRFFIVHCNGRCADLWLLYFIGTLLRAQSLLSGFCKFINRVATKLWNCNCCHLQILWTTLSNMSRNHRMQCERESEHPSGKPKAPNVQSLQVNLQESHLQCLRRRGLK